MRIRTIIVTAVLVTAAGVGVASVEATYDKVWICHRDQGKPEWKKIQIDKHALDAHLNHQWGEDIYPVPADGCPKPPPPESTTTTTTTSTTTTTTLPPTTTASPTTEPPTTPPTTEPPATTPETVAPQPSTPYYPTTTTTSAPPVVGLPETS